MFKRHSLSALTQDVECSIHWKQSTIIRCLNVLIVVSYVLHRVVNLLIMWRLIIHSINCPLHLLYCALCKSLYNVSVLTHDCNIIKSQHSIPLYFKYHENSLPYYSHKDVYLWTNSYIETFEDRGKINNDMLLSVALSQPSPTSVLIRIILQRQNGVEYLSSFNTYTN